MMLQDYLASYRKQFPVAAEIPDEDLVQMVSGNDDFNPEWLQQPTVAAPEAAPVEESSAFDRFFASPAASVLSGFEGIASGIDTVAQIATRQEGFTPVKSAFELPGRALAAGEALVSGRVVGDFWAPVDTKAAIDEMKSSQFQQAVSERASAMDKAGTIFGSEGLGQAWAGIKETVTSPDLILDMVASQLPQLVAMAATGGGTRVVTAVGAGLQGASSAADRLSEDAATLKSMTPEQALEIPAIKSLVDEGSSLEDAKAAVMLNAATMTLGLSTVGSLLATKLTGGQLEKLIGRLASGVPVKAVGTVGESAVKEFTQEALEEATGQLASNIGAQQISPETDLMEGVLAAAGLGGVGGAIIGGGLSGLVGGQQAAPAAAPAQPEAKPVFSYGDIQPPTVERPDYMATATVEGEEVQFLGATEEEVAIKRDAYIKEITAVPAPEEGAVEKAPEVVDELTQLGLTSEQIRALSPQDAVGVLERVEAARPALFQGAEADAEYARSEVRLNILKNAATAERLNQELAVQQAQGLQAQEAARVELAKAKQRVADLEFKIADTKAKAVEAKARKAQAEAASAEAQATKSWAKGVALRGKPVTGVETVAPGPVVTPFTGGEQAAQAEGVPSGTVNVAAVETPAAGAVVESTVSPTTLVGPETSEEVVTVPAFVAPTQSFTLAARTPELRGEPGKEPEKIRGKTTRGDTRYAAVFSDASGNRVAIPVFYKGKGTELRVLLDTRSRAEALAGLNKLPVERRDAVAIEAAAKAAGFPLLNESTLNDYAAANGLTFTGVVFKSDKQLNPGAHALPTVRNDLVPPGSVLFPAAEGSDRKIKRKTLGGYSQSTQDRLVRALQDTPNLLKETQGIDPWVAGGAALKVISAQPDIPVGFSELRVSESLDTKRTAVASAYGLLELARGKVTPLKIGRSRSEVLATTEPTPAPAPVVEGRLSEEERRAAGERVVERALGALRSFTPRADKLLAEVMKPEYTADPVSLFVKFTENFGARFERGMANSPEATQALALNLLNGVRAALSTPKDAPASVNEIESTIAEASDISLSGAAADKPYPPYRPVLDLFDTLSSLSSVTPEKIAARLRVLAEAAPVKERAGWRALVGSNATPDVITKVWGMVSKLKAEVDPSISAAEQEVNDLAFRKEVFSNILVTGRASAEDMSTQEEISVSEMTESGMSEATDILRTERPLTAQESQELGSYRGETDTVQFLRNLAARGVNVSFTDLKNAVAGRFSEGHVAIFANWADRASASTFGVALHEATHHFVSQLPPAARLALHRSVDQLTGRLLGRSDIDPRVGFKSYAEYLASKPEQVLSPSAWAEEVIAETAALNGMDRSVSRTAWAMIVRQAKLLALRVNMYLQEQFMGPDGVNPEFVSKWVDAQIDATIAGDALRMGSFMDRFIGLRPTLGEMAINHVDPRNVWQSSAMDPVTGQVTHVTPLGTSSSAIQTAIMMSVEALKQDALLTGAWNRDTNLQALAEIMQTSKPAPTGAVQANTSLMLRFAKRAADSKVAAALEISKPFEAAFAKLAALMPEISEASRNLARRRGETLPESVTREYVANLIGHNLSEKVIADAQDGIARIMKTETGVDAPPDLVSTKTTLDTLTDISTRHKAHEELHTLAAQLARTTAAKEVAAREALLKAEDTQLRTAALLAKYVTDPADWTQHAQHISASIAEAFEQISKDQALLTKKEAQVSDVSSMLRQMETSNEARASMDKNVQEMLAKVSIDTLTLNSIMRELLSLETSTAHKVDFSQSVKVIRETVLAYVKTKPESSLAVLTTQQGSGDLRGSALLSALITYVRRNELAVDLMRSTLVKGNLELAALAEFQSVMRVASDKKLDELAALQTAQRELPTNRFVQKALNTRDKFTRAADDVVQLKRDLAILKTMSGTFAQAQKLAESELNVIGDLYIHGPTATFAHPTSVNDSIDKVYEPSRVKTVGEISDADLRKVIADVRAYLEANKNRPESQGYLFNKLQRQNTAMTAALVGDGPKSAMAAIFNARLRGFAESFLGAGVKGGDRLAARVSRYSSLVSQWGTKVKKISSEYERNLEGFLKASGIKYEDFYESYYTPATGLAQVYPGERTEVQAQIDRLLSENAATKEAWSKPGAKKAFWSFLDSCEKGMSALAEMQKESGADLVSDPEMVNPSTKEKGAYRKQLRRGWLTFPMHTAKPLKAWANSVPLKFQDSSQVNLFTNPLAELSANAAQNRAEMAEFLGRDGWREFMQPLLTNDLSGTPGPKHADGERYNISTSLAKTLAAKADGDLFRFAELVHRESDTTESLEDFTSALIKHVGTIWNQVNSQTRELAPTTSSLFQSPGIPNIGLDARVTQTWPIGWKASMEFNDAAMRRASSGIAAASAFGREMSEALVDLAAMDNEIGNKLKEIEGRYTARGISLREQMLAKRSPLELSKLGIGTADWQQYQALKGYQDVKWKENLIGVLNSDNTIGLSDPTAMALWGTYVMNLTAGFRSALKNPTSLLNQFALAGEFSADSAMDTLGNYGQLFKQIASSVTGSVIPFYKPGSNDVNIQAMKLAGVYDPITDVRLLDSLKGGRGAGGDTPPLVRNMRRISEVLKDTRLGFGFGKDIVSLRAFDWFGWTQLLTQLSAVNNNLNLYYEIVQSMASYGRAGGDLTQPLTTKQLGLRGSDTRLTNMLAAFTQAGGADMLTLASEIATNPKMSELEIKQRLVPTVNKITADRISSEGSISSNPAWLSSSKIGRVGGTFVGFQLRQMGNLVKPFIDAQTNKVSAPTLLRGAGMVALGMMPGIIAYSMMLDMWDDLTEKKRDKIQLRLGSEQTGEQRLQALIEAFNDVGALSFLWEVPNQVINAYQGTAGKGALLSVDNRVVAISALNNFIRTFRDTWEYGFENLTMSTTGMQALNALGLQAQIGNLDTVNRLTKGAVEQVPVLGGFVTSAAERQDRISINNYIRVAGRAERLPVRQYGSTVGGDVPSKMNPHIVDMQLAALEKDEARFDRAKAKAFEEAQKVTPFANPAEAWKTVVSKYTRKHPLRGNFSDPLTQEQINTLLNNIEKNYPGKAATIKQSLTDFNSMGARKLPGFKPVVGTNKPSMAARETIVAEKQGKTAAELRKELIKARNSDL